VVRDKKSNENEELRRRSAEILTARLRVLQALSLAEMPSYHFRPQSEVQRQDLVEVRSRQRHKNEPLPQK